MGKAVLNVTVKESADPTVVVKDLRRRLPGCTRAVHVFYDEPNDTELYRLLICDVPGEHQQVAIEYLRGRDDIEDVEVAPQRRALSPKDPYRTPAPAHPPVEHNAAPTSKNHVELGRLGSAKAGGEE